MSFSARIKLVFSSIWTFLEPFVKLFVSSAGQILSSVALDAVKMVAADPSMLKSGGLEKRQAAFNIIVASLKAKGIEASTSIINAAIEAAVQKVKGDEE